LCANAGCEVDPDGGVSLAPATVGVGSVAIGAFSNSAGDQSIALGQSALSSGPGSVALGSAARASGAGSVVLGAGSTDGGEVDVVSVGATGAERKIINVATGALSATSTEAVNGSQLYATNTRQATIGASVSAALGGGAIYDPVTGSIGAPSYTVQSATYDNIGGAIGALDAGLSATNATVANLSSEVAAGNAGPVRRTGAPNQVALVADGGTAASPGAAQVLTNVAAGDVSATSSEAVNGSQIYATNTRQAAVGASISAVLGGGATYDPATGSIGAPSYTVQSATYDNIGGAIGALDSGLSATNTTVANLSNEVASGNAGPVRRTGALNQVTLVADGGTAASPGAAQILTNVAAGDVSATSSDAVNGSQLYATNKAVSTLAGSVDNGTVGTVQRTPGAPNQLTLTAPGATAVSPGAPQALTNVAPGRISPGSLDAVNGSQLYASQGATLAHAKAYTDVVGSQLSKEIHALGARDAALASLPQAVIPGRSTFSMALGVDQTTAVAAAYSRVFDDRYATALKASIAAAPVTGDVSAGVGIGWSF
jgi:autotransporter adhesin